MANRQVTANKFYHYAIVDTATAAAGYFCAEINPRGQKIGIGSNRIYFSVRDNPGAALVTLQFKCPTDSNWSDHSTYNTNARKVIVESAVDVAWRAGVKQNDYISGSVTFGFDW